MWPFAVDGMLKKEKKKTERSTQWWCGWWREQKLTFSTAPSESVWYFLYCFEQHVLTFCLHVWLVSKKEEKYHFCWMLRLEELSFCIKKKSKSETEFILQTKGAWNESSELLTGSVLGQKECENEADVYVMWTGCDIRNMMCNIHDVGEREREELHSFGILVEVSTLLLISWPPVT